MYYLWLVRPPARPPARISSPLSPPSPFSFSPLSVMSHLVTPVTLVMPPATPVVVVVIVVVVVNDVVFVVVIVVVVVVVVAAVVLVDHLEGPALQIFIGRDRPLAYDYPEGPASCN